LAEYRLVLARPKFKFDVAVQAQWLELVETRAHRRNIPSQTIAFSRDVSDEPFLSAALANSVDYLVTGDRD
jgi:predicted nucleic acid-binding protein